MSSWLTMLTTACCTQLGDMGSTLNTMKDRYVYWNDDYYQKAQNLVNQRQYQGKGATAFLEAVDTDINVFRPIYDGIGHAGSACANLQSVIATSSAKYENEIAAITPSSPPYSARWELSASVFNTWREQLLQKTLTDTGSGGGDAEILGSVLTNGTISMYLGAYQAVEEIVLQDAAAEIQRCLTTDPSLQIPSYLNPQLDPGIAKNPDLAQQSALMQSAIQQAIEQIKQEIQTQYLAVFNQLADEIEHDLTSWGTELCRAHDEFQAAIQQSESYLTARDLFDVIYNDVGGSQSTTKPITITPYRTKDGKTGLLITLGGTDLTDWSWDTNLFTALQAGMGFDNPYLIDVRLAIQAYMKEHPEMVGSEITFAGYSLGGMTAQQMAQDISNGDDPILKEYSFRVAQIITYGAPVMGSRLQNVQYEMYDATYDPVPLLSSYENPGVSHKNLVSLGFNLSSSNPLLLQIGLQDDTPGSALATIAANKEPWNARLHDYIDPKGKYSDHIHNISDVGQYNSGNLLLNIANHMAYYQSNQLNAPGTAITNIDPAKFGPTEYFGMKNTDNFYAKFINSPESVKWYGTPAGAK